MAEATGERLRYSVCMEDTWLSEVSPHSENGQKQYFHRAFSILVLFLLSSSVHLVYS